MIIIGTDYHPSFQQIAFVLEVPLPQGQGRRHWPRWGAGVSNILTLRKHSDAVVTEARRITCDKGILRQRSFRWLSSGHPLATYIVAIHAVYRPKSASVSAGSGRSRSLLALQLSHGSTRGNDVALAAYGPRQIVESQSDCSRGICSFWELHRPSFLFLEHRVSDSCRRLVRAANLGMAIDCRDHLHSGGRGFCKPHER